jgi:2'-5' RNA ligase
MSEIGKQRPESLAAETSRVFFALWPDEAIRGQFMQWARLLHETCGGGITRPGNLHITLAFLGNVAVSRLDKLKLLAGKLGGSAFNLNFTSPGYWSHNRIVWAAPDETPQVLSDLVKKLECSLQIAGFSFDERPYVSHLTLLRNARWDPPARPLKNIKWEISEFVLLRSKQAERRAEYEIVGRWPLS